MELVGIKDTIGSSRPVTESVMVRPRRTGCGYDTVRLALCAPDVANLELASSEKISPAIAKFSHRFRTVIRLLATQNLHAHMFRTLVINPQSIDKESTKFRASSEFRLAYQPTFLITGEQLLNAPDEELVTGYMNESEIPLTVNAQTYTDFMLAVCTYPQPEKEIAMLPIDFIRDLQINEATRLLEESKYADLKSYVNEVSKDQLQLEAYIKKQFFTEVRDLITCCLSGLSPSPLQHDNRIITPEITSIPDAVKQVRRFFIENVKNPHVLLKTIEPILERLFNYVPGNDEDLDTILQRSEEGSFNPHTNNVTIKEESRYQLALTLILKSTHSSGNVHLDQELATFRQSVKSHTRAHNPEALQIDSFGKMFIETTCKELRTHTSSLKHPIIITRSRQLTYTRDGISQIKSEPDYTPKTWIKVKDKLQMYELLSQLYLKAIDINNIEPEVYLRELDLKGSASTALLWTVGKSLIRIEDGEEQSASFAEFESYLNERCFTLLAQNLESSEKPPYTVDELHERLFWMRAEELLHYIITSGEITVERISGIAVTGEPMNFLPLVTKFISHIKHNSFIDDTGYINVTNEETYPFTPLEIRRVWRAELEIGPQEVDVNRAKNRAPQRASSSLLGALSILAPYSHSEGDIIPGLSPEVTSLVRLLYYECGATHSIKNVAQEADLRGQIDTLLMSGHIVLLLDADEVITTIVGRDREGNHLIVDALRPRDRNLRIETNLLTKTKKLIGIVALLPKEGTRRGSENIPDDIQQAYITCQETLPQTFEDIHDQLREGANSEFITSIMNRHARLEAFLESIGISRQQTPILRTADGEIVALHYSRLLPVSLVHEIVESGNTNVRPYKRYTNYGDRCFGAAVTAATHPHGVSGKELDKIIGYALPPVDKWHVLNKQAYWWKNIIYFYEQVKNSKPLALQWDRIYETLNRNTAYGAELANIQAAYLVSSIMIDALHGVDPRITRPTFRRAIQVDYARERNIAIPFGLHTHTDPKYSDPQEIYRLLPEVIRLLNLRSLLPGETQNRANHRIEKIYEVAQKTTEVAQQLAEDELIQVQPDGRFSFRYPEFGLFYRLSLGGSDILPFLKSLSITPRNKPLLRLIDGYYPMGTTANQAGFLPPAQWYFGTDGMINNTILLRGPFPKGTLRRLTNNEIRELFS